ncbi:MAG: FHA domain-containing protein, partial [Polyangiaceae bacterium]
MTQLGKEAVSIGSDPHSDVVLQGPGVAPQHARIVKQNGQLFFVDAGVAPSFANGAPVQPQQPVPFDFRTQFAVGQVPVPLTHPAIVSMLMSPGQVQPPRGHIVIGREASRASLVIAHSSVSGQHATVMLDRMMVQDN